jgi:hypothetical protein
MKRNETKRYSSETETKRNDISLKRKETKRKENIKRFGQKNINPLFHGRIKVWQFGLPGPNHRFHICCPFFCSSTSKNFACGANIRSKNFDCGADIINNMPASCGASILTKSACGTKIKIFQKFPVAVIR